MKTCLGGGSSDFTYFCWQRTHVWRGKMQWIQLLKPWTKIIFRYVIEYRSYFRSWSTYFKWWYSPYLIYLNFVFNFNSLSFFKPLQDRKYLILSYGCNCYNITDWSHCYSISSLKNIMMDKKIVKYSRGHAEEGLSNKLISS